MVNLLIIQDTDWIIRGPHQQHHIFERLDQNKYSIGVIDFEILWNKQNVKAFFQKERVFKNISHVKTNKIEIIRPAMIKIPLLDKITLPFFHMKAINRILKQKKIDLIVGQTILNTFCGLILSKIYHIPFLYHVMDSIHSIAADYIPKYFLFVAKVLETLIIKFSDVVITVNKGLKEYIVKLGGDPAKVFVIPAGVDFNKYQMVETRDQIRKKFGIRNEDLILFFMGWLYSFSGLKELADYLLVISDASIKLLVVGEGDLYLYLLTSSKKSDKIIMTGQVPFEEIPKYLSAADICVLPAYRNEIMMNIVPIKLIEYMAAGKPVISSKLQGVIREFGKNNGILYCDDVKDLVSIALELRKERKMEAIGKQGANFIKKLDWDILVKEFEKVMIRTIEAHKEST
jgi:glycosyltransferase involved in cell wall biosynthesis